LEATVVREATSVSFERYSIVILDAEDGTLLDYTRLGGLDPEEARSIVWRLYTTLADAQGIGALVEADIITEAGYVKVIVEKDAGIVRGIVTVPGHEGSLGVASIH